MKSRRISLAAFALALALASALLASDDPKKLESTPRVKAYRALLAAMNAGDYAACKSRMVREAGARMDETTKRMGKNPGDVLAHLARLTPPDVAVTDLEVDGKRAVLHAVGRLDGETHEGTVELSEEEGEWRVIVRTWTTRKARSGAPPAVPA